MLPHRFAWLGLLAWLLAAQSLAAEPPKPAKPQTDSRPRLDPSSGVRAQYSESEVRILHALDEPTEIEFIEAPLSDVIEFLKTKHRLEIQLDSKALDEAGVAKDSQVTRNVKNIKLSSALDIVLRDFDLDYCIRDEVLLITTVAQSDTILDSRIYPVHDLIVPAESSTSVWHTPGSQLVEVITSAVAPNTWMEVGGPATIKYWADGHSLVISQSWRVHREIRDLLDAMRQVTGYKPISTAAPAPSDPDRLQLAIYPVPRGPALRFAIEELREIAEQSTPAEKDAHKPGDSEKAASEKAGNDKAGKAKADAPTPRIGLGTRVLAEDLAQAIPRMIQPKSWIDGGGQGAIEIVGDELVVRQTRHVHAEIADFLETVARPGPGGHF